MVTEPSTTLDLEKLSQTEGLALPWKDFIRWALLQESDANQDVPSSDLFVLARLVKTWCKVGTSPAVIWPRVNEAARVAGGWEHIGIELSGEDLVAKFCHCWDATRFLANKGPLEQALVKAKAEPLTLGEEYRQTPGYVQFVSFCAHLQVTRGNADIGLPCKKIGELLNVRPNTISVWIAWAISAGFLTRRRAHHFERKSRRESGGRISFRC